MELTLERIFSDPPLEGTAPSGLQLSPGGKYVAFLKPNDKDSDVLDLWGARLPDGSPQLLVATADLLLGKEQKLTEQERMALERKRISKRGITGYVWCGDAARALVFPLSGDLYFARLEESGPPKVARLTADADDPEQNPVCSRSGNQIAFVKRGNVTVMDIATQKARTLATGASATRTFGLPEFIAEEEMHRHEGMWWAPDEKSLLVFEVDESAVGIKTRAQIFSDRTELVEQRYPAAGEKNAAVTAWLVDVKTGHKRRLETPADDGYLARAGFFPDGMPWVEWQSRDQTRLVLLEGTGPLRPILEETDQKWVELHDDLVALKDGKRLLWSSERSGRKQLVVVDRQTGAVTPLTAEPEAVVSLLAVDQDKGVAFFDAYRDRGRQLQVFAVSLAGGSALPITTEPGWHGAKFDDTGRFFVDKHSDFGLPPSTVVKDAAGHQVFVVDENAATELSTFARSTPQWLDIQAEDGTVLNGLLLPPTRMEEGKKYPVVTVSYGGPGAITVVRAWKASFPLHTFWNQRGFGVFLLDNRGMGGHDRAYAHAHYRRFGDIEIKDLFAGVEQLKTRVPWVDSDKIGLFGWSYGGFVAARAVLDEKSPFAAAVAVAPVTDWTLYDTHYTERYLGMPLVDGKLAPAYESANLVRRAKLLSRPLLLVHGTADDNVLFEHSLRLIEALQKEGRAFELMIYPGKAHGISGRPAQRHVYTTVTSFFERSLR